MHTIGMDTYLLITDGVAAAEGEVAGRIRPFRWWIRGKTAAGVENPAPPGARKGRRGGQLRTRVRCAIMRVIAQLSPLSKQPLKSRRRIQPAVQIPASPEPAAPDGFPDVADALSDWIDRDQWP